jgi:ribosomal protein S18 acetylase RimI-like enzyme
LLLADPVANDPKRNWAVFTREEFYKFLIMQVRVATPDDSSRCAEIHFLARSLMSYLPQTHTSAQVLAWKQHVVFPQQAVWVAEINQDIVGYASLDGQELTNLYVHPDYQGRGAGTALLALVKTVAKEGLRLWTFQKNEGAIRFYERNGFLNLRTTDGSENEEGLPACLMVLPTPAARP